MDKVKNILKFAMRMEKDASDFYSYYMDKAETEETRKLFAELAEIEKRHYNILKNKFDELQFAEPPLTISWVVDDSFKAQDPHILSDNADTIPMETGDSSDVSIIRMAYLIEHDFAYFYSKAVEAVEEPEAKKFLQELSSWETQHSEMFQKKYQTELEKRWRDIADLVL